MGRGGRVYDMVLYMDRRLHWAGACIFMVGEEYFLDWRDKSTPFRLFCTSDPSSLSA